MMTTDLTTSKVIEDRTIDHISILKIDFKASTAHDMYSPEAHDILIQGDRALIAQRINDDEVKFYDDGNLRLSSPYSLSGEGKVIYKSKNQKVNYSYQGRCIEVGASDFNDGLN